MKKWIPVLIFAVSLSLNAQTTTTTAPTIAEIVTVRVDHLTKLLNLTTAQAASATATFTIEVTAVEPLQASLATAKTALDTAIESDSTTGITAAIATISSLRSQILQAEATADATFYASLTAPQQTIDKELLAVGVDFYGHPNRGMGNGGHGGH